jgi:peptidoglycan-associated lipoprotein
MNPITLRLCAALLLLAGCSSADETPQGAGLGEGAGAGGGRTGAGIASSELAGQPTPGTQEDLAVSVGDRVFFDYDSVVLNPEATTVLDGQAAWLKQYPDVIVTIEGHADERGTREYNLALGDRRANAVKNYLVALDISPARILTISYGEERPADPGHDDAAWSQNRRAVTTVATTG